MDNQNLPTAVAPTQAIDTDKSQSMTDACLTMKDQIDTEAQQMVSGQETMGKPQPLNEAIAVMKEEIKTEAEQILSPQAPAKPKDFTDACAEIKEESQQEAQRIVPGREDTTHK